MCIVMWGSIPAWAGETVQVNNVSDGNGVYPRVGGGNGIGNIARTLSNGLSPRGRGKPSPSGIPGEHHRSIPAWAGETPNGGG